MISVIMKFMTAFRIFPESGFCFGYMIRERACDMGFEIERKWLVRELPGDIGSFPHKEYVQGYLCTEPTVRVRREGDEYVLTYKGGGLMKREEYNLPLTKEAFDHLVIKCDGKLIHKTRYFIPVTSSVKSASGEMSVPEEIDRDAVSRCRGGIRSESADHGDPDAAADQEEKLTIELDIYKEKLSGLITAEIEFASEEEALLFMPPKWFSEDVTYAPEYKNSYLALH